MTKRTCTDSYRLPADCDDARWYVLSPFGSAVATATTEEWARSLAEGFAADAPEGERDYLVIDTEGLA